MSRMKRRSSAGFGKPALSAEGRPGRWNRRIRCARGSNMAIRIRDPIGTVKYFTLQRELDGPETHFALKLGTRNLKLETGLRQMSDIGKVLIFFGVILVAVGLLLVAIGRTNLPLGRLPGDILYRGKHTTFYFPLVTCILLSVIVSFVLFVIGKFRH